ncbi:hypothetical protein M9H77_06296 [Catharanthus roseus]|uniref:Uncharacterized protein n=1 Tax=Catharanthus roseus TaxID=4058 RepID=A0ACC0BRN1_CATRO|nr:hypothetical protein M9H77_06296 [Catharanthus roseus]
MASKLIILLCVTLSIYTNFLFFCSAAETPNPVLDFVGTKVRTGVPYHIITSTIDPPGGGMMSDCTYDNTTCPIEVMKNIRGLPMYFSPVNPKKGIIRESTDLNIIFWYTKDVWKVDRKLDESSQKYFVTNGGGVVGNPGPQTLDNWFKFEKYEDGYKIVHCPSVCRYCKVMCKDVGIFEQNGKVVLALSNEPIKILLKEHYIDD